MTDRMAEQMRLISDYKYLESQKEGKELEYKEAMKRFIENKYAEKFAEIYQDGMTHEELKKKLFG